MDNNLMTSAGGVESLVGDFIQTAVDCGALTFGSFTLKSGRQSPFFFNSAKCMTGRALHRVAKAIAERIVRSGVQFDVLFGPAYKGIPLVAAVAMSLAADFGIDAALAYDRKEEKDHGDGGRLIDGRDALIDGGTGNPCRVLIIDDVITAGTAISHVVQLLKQERPGAKVVGVVICLDRQESAVGGEVVPKEKRVSAVQLFQQQHGVPVLSVATLSDLLSFLQKKAEESANSSSQLRLHQSAVASYIDKYGVQEGQCGFGE